MVDENCTNTVVARMLIIASSSTVSLHTMSHGRDRNKMVFFVVVALILLKEPAERHRTRSKEKAGADYYQCNRNKETRAPLSDYPP